MANYETALILALFGVSFYLLYLADKFKIEGESPWRALINGIINLVLKLSSFGTIIYNVFFIRLIIQDQTGSASITSILDLLNQYTMSFLYGVSLIFFLCYFLLQFINLVENFRINKMNKQIDKQEGGFNRFK